MNISGLLAGIGEKAHEQNLLTLQQNAQTRQQVLNMMLSSMGNLPPDRAAQALQMISEMASDPHAKPDKYAKQYASLHTTPVDVPQQETVTPPALQMPAPSLGGGPAPTGGEIPPPPAVTGPAPVPIPSPPSTVAGPPLRMMPAEAEARRRADVELSQYTAKARAQATAQREAQLEMVRAERADLEALGTKMGLKGDDLANFVITKTLRDPATKVPQFSLVTGTMDGKPAYAWKDPAGLLREYTTAGPGAPIPPGKFVPKETGQDSTFEQMVQTFVHGGMTEDEARKKVWKDMHPGPQPPVPIYIAGLGLMDRRTGELKAKIDVPTTTTRTMAEKAPKVVALADRITQQVQEQRAQLGPGVGRWNEFWTTDVGVKNPGFKRLRDNSSLLSSLLMQMHVGSRGSEYMVKKFDDMIAAGKQDPDNMLATMETIKAYAQDVQNVHATVTPVGKGAATNPPPPGSPKVGDKKTFPNGKTGVWDGNGWVAQ